MKVVSTKKLEDGAIEVRFKLGRYEHVAVYEGGAFHINLNLNLTQQDLEDLEEQMLKEMRS